MNTSNKQPDWKRCAELAHDFLDSLPRGWLGHTSGDIGLLNDFYIQYGKCTQKEHEENAASNLNISATNTATT